MDTAECELWMYKHHLLFMMRSDIVIGMKLT